MSKRFTNQEREWDMYDRGKNDGICVNNLIVIMSDEKTSLDNPSGYKDSYVKGELLKALERLEVLERAEKYE